MLQKSTKHLKSQLKSLIQWKEANLYLVDEEISSFSALKAPFSMEKIMEIAFGYRIFSTYLTSTAVAQAHNSREYWELLNYAAICACSSQNLFCLRNLQVLSQATNSSDLAHALSVYSVPQSKNHVLCGFFALYSGLEEHIKDIKAEVETLMTNCENIVIPSLVSFFWWALTNEYKSGARPSLSWDGYKEFSSTWNRPNGNSMEAVKDLCDYHCQRMVPVSSDLNDFCFAPFNIIPYEILVFLKRADLTIENIDHPLFDYLRTISNHPFNTEWNNTDVLKLETLFNDFIPEGLRPIDFLNNSMKFPFEMQP